MAISAFIEIRAIVPSIVIINVNSANNYLICEQCKQRSYVKFIQNKYRKLYIYVSLKYNKHYLTPWNKWRVIRKAHREFNYLYIAQRLMKLTHFFVDLYLYFSIRYFN